MKYLSQLASILVYFNGKLENMTIGNAQQRSSVERCWVFYSVSVSPGPCTSLLVGLSSGGANFFHLKIENNQQLFLATL